MLETYWQRISANLPSQKDVSSRASLASLAQEDQNSDNDLAQAELTYLLGKLA
jgi:hypothetical protein